MDRMDRGKALRAGVDYIRCRRACAGRFHVSLEHGHTRNYEQVHATVVVRGFFRERPFTPQVEHSPIGREPEAFTILLAYLRDLMVMGLPREKQMGWHL